jgi:hypothetical protein
MKLEVGDVIVDKNNVHAMVLSVEERHEGVYYYFMWTMSGYLTASWINVEALGTSNFRKIGNESSKNNI